MMATLALLLLAAAPSPAQRLTDARRLMNELQYEQALKTATAALDQAKDVDRDTLVGLYEFSGIAWAAVDKPAKAKDAFQRLLSLAPDYQLSKDLPPRTRTPFFEAKTWVDANGAVSVQVEAVREAGQVKELRISVADNALVPARAVRVGLTVEGRAEPAARLPVTSGRATLEVGAPAVQWAVEVLGDKGVLRAASGESVPPVVAPPVTAPRPLPAVAASAAPGWLRPAGLAVGGAGLAALVAGGVLGYLSFDARSQLASAERNMAGVVTGLTERQAAQLDQSARTFALVANALFITGGLLAATGLGLFIFGPAETGAPQVAVLPLGPLGASALVRF